MNIEFLDEQIRQFLLKENCNIENYENSKKYKKDFIKEKIKILENLYNSEDNQKKLNELNLITEDFLYNKVETFLINLLQTSKLYLVYFKKRNKKFKKINHLNFNEFTDELSTSFLFNIGSDYGNKIKSIFSIIKIYLIDVSVKKLNTQKDIDIVIKQNDKFEIVNIGDYINSFNRDNLLNKVNKTFTKEFVLKNVFLNNRYKDIKNKYISENYILKEIPSDFTLLFPEARLINRHFILHIGDTNTGKTYEALQELKNAESGVYLAPLRLLALEVQERLNNEGTLCSMSTGEEEDIVEGAKHMSSTIEKLNTNKYYDVSVIDEAQMIEDDNRGWAWTNAILGVNSERIHICMSENAKNIVIKLIESCHDTYEIKEHYRNTELKFENKNFNFDKDIKKHDALILFSRNKVLSVASELEKRGIKASVIYGALPYSVRKNEVQKFLNGETEVVVSTDAIGMGMNLPIKRIVFLESSKFDGKSLRELNISEVKQISGRAGRRGMFEVGYVNAMVDKNIIKDILFSKYTPIQYAKIQLPKSLLNIDLPLSEIIKSWANIPDKGYFKKANTDIYLRLCLLLERYMPNLSKECILDLINIPFDENNEELERLWFELISLHFNNEDILDNMDILEVENKDTLEMLELKYKKLDLYYSFAKTVKYNRENFLTNISKLKEEISLAIIEQLKTKEIQRTCKLCKKVIAWDYPYSICQRCYTKRYY